MKPLLVLTGPTASGKSEIAFEVSPGLRAEIVCADSRQIFRGVEIGSATPVEWHGIPHHLFGVLPPGETCSAGAYRDMAWAVIQSIHERGNIPLLVGGTGLYIEAVTGEISLAPPLKAGTAEALRARLAGEGAAALHGELASLDPAAAAAISPGDSHRIVRALGILIDTGRRQSSFAKRGEPVFSPIVKVALDVPREILYRRIDERCQAMFLGGVLSEALLLKNAGLAPNLPALKSIGYRYLYEVLEGRLSREEALTLMSRDTRRYAKRQMTWIRGRKGIMRVPAEDRRTAIQAVIGHFQNSLKEETKCA